MQIIETERLIIRTYDISDAESILRLLNEPAFIQYIGDKDVKTLADATDYIESGPMKMQQEFGFSLYCCIRKTDGKVVGMSGLVKREGIEHPEIGFAFYEEYCRLGYGYESSIAIINYASEKLNLHTLQAITNVDNIASIKLLEKLGFKYQKLIQLSKDSEMIKLFERKSS